MHRRCPLRHRRRSLAAAAAAAGALLALLPATGAAALVTFGSDLTAPANLVQARQADTAYWQTTFADARSPLAPATGQIRSFRVKGIALSNPVAGVPGGETMFHLQALRARPDGTFRSCAPARPSICPRRAADPQSITTYEPENFCIDKGDVLVFNTVGGWDGVVNQTGPYPMGTPLQIFSRVPGANVAEFEGADRTNNGDVITASSTRTRGHELLMQLTVGSGPDATALCPGGQIGLYVPPPPVGRARRRGSRRRRCPPRQRVTVSRKGKMSISLFCLPGASHCAADVRVLSRGARPKSLGTGRTQIGPKSTGHSTVWLNKLGRRMFARAKGRLPVNIVAETAPGGESRRSSLAKTLRRRGS